MARYSKPYPLATLFGIQKDINTRPDWQRPAVWGKAQKESLVDTILRDYDIPKIYWRKVGAKPDKYEVIDGQQRLRAIWEFMNGSFSMSANASKINDEEIANYNYENLPNDFRISFDTYTLDIVIIDDLSDEDVRDMFLRLQNGTTLMAQEKRNAFPGKMRDFVKEIGEHPFFGSVGFNNTRFAHDHLAAQLVCMEIAGGPTNIKNSDLNKMYKKYEKFNAESQEAKKVQRVLKIMHTIFPDKTPELKRFNVVSLYCVISEFLENFVISEIQNGFHDWFIDFESRRGEEETKSEEKASAEWLSYKDKISHSNDSQDSIRSRKDFMLRDIFEGYPALSRKDNQRNFTNAQRLTVFRRGNGQCQVKLRCKGVKLAWDSWHCDHIKPWSRGGKTTVENGRAACPECNQARGNDPE